MKRIILVFTLVTISTITFAQKKDEKVKEVGDTVYVKLSPLKERKILEVGKKIDSLQQAYFKFIQPLQKIQNDLVEVILESNNPSIAMNEIENMSLRPGQIVVIKKKKK